MLLHISDDSNFLNYAINQFEEVIPNRNIYLINRTQPENVKDLSRVVCANSESEIYKNYINQLDSFEAVIIHALTYDKAMIINKTPKNVKFVWMLWGGDGFYLNQFKNRWYSDGTKLILKSLYQDNNNYLKILKNNRIYEYYRFFRRGKFSTNYVKLKAIKKIKYLAPVIKQDYYILKKELGLKVTFLPFSYGCIEVLINENSINYNYRSKREQNNNILIGNSADPSNNHIDIFQLIEKEKIQGKFICPLSYSGQKYKLKITEIGSRILGKSFYPITDILPMKQYQKLLKSCSVVIMNHYRQQGMGNIISSLWNGSKIFLNEKNPLYSHFKEIGIKLFKIDDIDKKDIFVHLSKEDIESNRKVLINHYSREKVIDKTREFVKIVLA